MRKIEQKIDYKAQLESIDKFRAACEVARSHLLPINEYGKSQLGVILGAALMHINNAELPYYSRAIQLLEGAKDRTCKVRGEWVIKRLKNGIIRRRGKDVNVIKMVDRI